MYIIKNAIQNIARNKGRNILMGIIIFAILLTSAISIIINITTDEIITDYKSRFGSEVYLNFDSERWVAEGKPQEGISMPTPKQYIAFSESEHLQRSVLTGYMLFTPDGFKFPDKGNGSANTGGGSSGNGGIITEASQDMLIAEDHVLESADFKNGIRRIIDGKEYREKNECIISKTVADLNGLTIGDIIKIKDITENSDESIALKITGIFEDYANPQDDEFAGMLGANKCDILTNFDTAVACKWFETAGQVNAIYFLKSPDHLEAFQKEISEKGLSKFYRAATDEITYNQIVGPVEGLSKVTNTFLVVVLVLGSIILILLSTLAIRERKYEIGVLRAMGMKKGKVAIGLMTEILVVTIICLVLGLGVGSFAAQPVANSLLEEQIKIAEEGSVLGGGSIILTPMTNNGTELETLSEIEVRLSGGAILQITLIALFLTIISSAAVIVYITRFEPMKILSERN